MQRNLYPELKPNSEQLLKVSNLHTIYTASYGNKYGTPVAVVHGGPGSGCNPDFARYFDPDRYHIILIDQRGAGKSSPKGEMRENTTQDLIADMEVVRKHYHINQWAVFGGSWGSTLSLLYAEAYPKRVLGLILRGIFLVEDGDASAFVRDDTPAAFFHSNDWKNFKARTTQLIRSSGLDLSVDRDPIYHIYYKILQTKNLELKKLAAATLAGWEKFNSSLIADPGKLNPGNINEDGVNMALTEATYFENNCFIRNGQIIEDIQQLAGIPVYIVQGNYDLVCPPYMADKLESALLKTNRGKPELVTRYDCLAGHTFLDAEIRNGLLRATDELAERLQPSERPRVAM